MSASRLKRKAVAKVRSLKHIFQIFSEVFFFFFFGGRLDALLRKGGGTAKKNILTSGEPGTISSNTDAFFFKSGCKGKDFTTYPPNFSGSFFSKSFFFEGIPSSGETGKGPYGAPYKMSYNEASVPESGCKTTLSRPNGKMVWQLFCT